MVLKLSFKDFFFKKIRLEILLFIESNPDVYANEIARKYLNISGAYILSVTRWLRDNGFVDVRYSKKIKYLNLSNKGKRIVSLFKQLLKEGEV